VSETPLYEVSLAELKDGRHMARVRSREILVVATEEGVRVWDGVCPHLAGPLLEGSISRQGIVCPWHRYAFDSATGRCLTIPGRMWKAVDPPSSAREPMAIALRPLRHEIDGGFIRIYET
jgi:3-ketosteroid 9alpha-monooxygenase subunit A